MGFPTDIGIIDPGVGFPYTSVEEKKATYDFMRPLYKDADTIDSMEFPAEYMFKDAPDVVDDGTGPTAHGDLVLQALVLFLYLLRFLFLFLSSSSTTITTSATNTNYPHHPQLAPNYSQ